MIHHNAGHSKRDGARTENLGGQVKLFKSSLNFRLTTPPNLNVLDIKWLAVYDEDSVGINAKIIFPTNTV